MSRRLVMTPSVLQAFSDYYNQSNAVNILCLLKRGDFIRWNEFYRRAIQCSVAINCTITVFCLIRLFF